LGRFRGLGGLGGSAGYGELERLKKSWGLGRWGRLEGIGRVARFWGIRRIMRIERNKKHHVINIAIKRIRAAATPIILSIFK